jgi:hypothetical protein
VEGKETNLLFSLSERATLYRSFVSVFGRIEGRVVGRIIYIYLAIEFPSSLTRLAITHNTTTSATARTIIFTTFMATQHMCAGTAMTHDHLNLI